MFLAVRDPRTHRYLRVFRGVEKFCKIHIKSKQVDPKSWELAPRKVQKILRKDSKNNPKKQDEISPKMTPKIGVKMAAQNALTPSFSALGLPPGLCGSPSVPPSPSLGPPWLPLGFPLGPLGSPLASPWALFATPWPPLGPSWRPLGLSLGPLAPPWPPLGPAWLPLRPPLGSLGAPLSVRADGLR